VIDVDRMNFLTLSLVLLVNFLLDDGDDLRDKCLFEVRIAFQFRCVCVCVTAVCVCVCV
jgi:hypothetical protein